MNCFKTKAGIIKFVVSVAVGLIIAFLPASEGGLSREALIFLGLFVWFVIVSMFDLMQMYVSGLIVLAMLVLTKVLTFEQAFAQYASSTPWLIFGVLGMAAALQATGLMNRIALWVLRPFPNTFGGQVTALTAVSAVLGPAIPSSPAKSSLIASLAVPLSQEAGYEKNSRANAGLFTAYFAPVVLFSPIFVSGAVGVPSMMAFMPEIKFSWLSWFSTTWWFGVAILILVYFFILFFYGPKKAEKQAAKAKRAEMKAQGIEEEKLAAKKLKEMGPMSLNEKIGLIVLIVAIVLWITESFHGVSTAMVGIAALLILTLIGIFSEGDYVGKIPWPVFLIAGAVMTMAGQFGPLGISSWIGATLTFLGPIAANPYILVAVLCVLCYALRFFIPSQLAIIAMMIALFGSVAQDAGISIFIVVWITWMITASWQTPFVNSSYFTAKGLIDQLCDHKYLRSGSYGVALIVFAVSIASVPIWQLTGWIA